jgi:hypothetical protein
MWRGRREGRMETASHDRATGAAVGRWRVRYGVKSKAIEKRVGNNTSQVQRAASGEMGGHGWEKDQQREELGTCNERQGDGRRGKKLERSNGGLYASWSTVLKFLWRPGPGREKPLSPTGQPCVSDHLSIYHRPFVAQNSSHILPSIYAYTSPSRERNRVYIGISRCRHIFPSTGAAAGYKTDIA